MKFLDRFRRKATEPEPAATPPVGKPAASAYSPEVKQALPQKKSPNPNELRFELGDFLHRIPAHLIQPGPHDLKTEICFEIKELSERIAKGQTTISLAEIYKRVPHVFKGQILDSDNIEVRFPWQKLARLVNSVRVDSKNAATIEGSADALAKKLRQKKAGDDDAAPPPAPSGPSVLLGIGGKQSAWFSKPTLDRTAEKTPPAAASPTTHLPEPPELKLVDSGSPEDQAPKATQDDLRISDLPADVARRVATIKGDYERQLSELDKHRRQAAEARERHAAEAERLRAELDKAKAQLSAEKTASSMSQELLERASQERLLVQNELNARLKELEEIQAQIAHLKDESKVAALTTERDALLQQKGYLTTQMAEVTKRGQPPKSSETGGGTSMGAQRQIEELQRRIGTLEASQRENALIIAREKELRAKAEKLLASAEKLQEQSANHMESAKTEMRKEIEASVRQRENDARKAQKELQDQITALSDQTRKTAVELENARAQNTELHAQLAAASAAATPQPDPLQAQLVTQLESDIENYRDRLKTLIRERDDARSEREKTPAISNEEIEKLAGEKSKLEAELIEVRKLQQEQAAAMELLQEQRANDQQRAEQERATHETRVASLLQSIESAQQSLSEKRASLEPVLAETRAELETLRAQHREVADKLQSERESFEQERQQTAASLREQSLSLEQQLAALVHERDQLRHDKDALATRIKSEAEAREDLITGLDREHTSVVRANEELTRRLADTERALREIEKERDRFASTDTAMLGDPALQSEVATLHAQLTSAVAERDEAKLAAKARNDALHESETTLNRLAGEQQQIVAEISEERAAKNRLQSELEALQGELAALRTSRETSESAGKENLADQLSEEREKTGRISAQLDAIEAELAGLRKEHEAAVSEKQKLASALAEIERTNHAALSDLATERDSIASALKAARETHKQSNASLEAEQKSSACAKADADVEIARLRKELSATGEAFADLKRTASEEVATLSKAKITLEEQSREEIETLTRTAQESQSAAATAREAQQSAAAALDDAQRQLSEVRSAGERQAVEFDKLRTALAAARHDYDELAQRAAIEKSGLRQQLDALTADLTRERESASHSSALSENLRQAGEELARARRDLAALHAEHDELTNRLERLTEELSAAQSARESEPARTHASTPPVIEVFEPEIVFPERENSIALPRVRPVPVAPPKVGVR